MQVGRVLVAADHRGDATLGPGRGGLRQVSFGQDADAQSRHLGKADDGRQTRHPASEDEHIEIERF